MVKLWVAKISVKILSRKNATLKKQLGESKKANFKRVLRFLALGVAIVKK
jgi:hypothetical protein